MVFVLNRFILQEPVSAPRDMKYKCVIPWVVSYGGVTLRCNIFQHFSPTHQGKARFTAVFMASFLLNFKNQCLQRKLGILIPSHSQYNYHSLLFCSVVYVIVFKLVVCWKSEANYRYSGTHVVFFKR